MKSLSICMAIFAVISLTDGQTTTAYTYDIYKILRDTLPDNQQLYWSRLARSVPQANFIEDLRQNSNSADKFKDSVKKLGQQVKEVFRAKPLNGKASCATKSFQKIVCCLVMSYPSVYDPATIHSSESGFESSSESNSGDYYYSDSDEWYRRYVSKEHDAESDKQEEVPAHASCLVSATIDYVLCSIAESAAASDQRVQFNSRVVYQDINPFDNQESGWEAGEDGKF